MLTSIFFIWLIIFISSKYSFFPNINIQNNNKFYNKNIFNNWLGIGIGTVFGSLIMGYARNPSLKQQLFSYAILGFALAEAMGLFCLMVAFLLLFAL